MSEEISDIDEAEYEKFVAQKQAERAQKHMRRAQNGDDNFSDSDNSDYWKEKPGALPKVLYLVIYKIAEAKIILTYISGYEEKCWRCSNIAPRF